MKTAAVALALSVIASAAFADDAIKLAVGARGNWETAAAELGQQAGFFKRHGIALEILYTQGSGETQQVVISGSVAIGVGLGTTSVMAAFAKGAPLRVIGNASTGSSEFWYVAANSPVLRMKDAGGKTVGFSTTGSSSHMEVLAFLKHEGVDAKPVATGGTAATFTQVMSGQVDIGWSSPPFGIEAAREGKIRIIARGNDLPYFRDQTIRLIVAHAGWLESHRDVAARFVQAYRDTLAWMYADPAGVAAYAGFAGTSLATAQQVRDEFYPRDGLTVDRISGLEAVMADGVANKYLAAPLTTDQLGQLFQVPAAK
ncbi:MAG: NitT/TauT family transport system substrate-binding protein [Alphaproteobacteria bacterium]|nr:NitT/TauT family transport system substrate-binding protein [Alphaproteobacteria bacterium]